MPRSSDVKITMSVSKDVKVPVDVQAVIMSPNLVAAHSAHLGIPAGRYCRQRFDDPDRTACR